MSFDETKDRAQVISDAHGDVDTEVARHGSIPGDLAAEAHQGVDGMERITMTWSTASLAIVYVVLWSCYFFFALERSFEKNLGPYITSLFGQHSLLATVSLAANIASSAVYMPIAKVLDMYGRAQALSLMTVVAMLGLILTAACQNIGTYCAGVIFTTVGFSGITYAVDVITADTSMLKSRALAYAFTASPYIITAFGGSAASENLLSAGHNWRWGYGALVIVLPFVVAVLVGVLVFNNRKARKEQTVEPTKPKRSAPQSVLAFLIEFDVLGIFVFVAGEVLLLLPFSLAEGSADTWATGYIIAMLVLGVVLLVAFVFIERYVPVSFANWNLLTTGTLLMVCLINIVYSIASATWNSYFTSYLQVVYGMSVSHAGYINSISSLTTGIWQIVTGIMIRLTGRYKWLMMIATPIYALFQGLLIYFRRPETNIGLIIMCEIFLAFSGSTIILCIEVATVADVSHADVAVAIGLLGTSGYIGSALGDSISGAIWTNTLPVELAKRLPAAYKSRADDIYDDLKTQLSFPMGNPVRTAIIDAYATAQTRMLIAGVVAAGVTLILIVFLKNIKLSARQQTKGRLF